MALNSSTISLSTWLRLVYISGLSGDVVGLSTSF
jgi:hypothetical protein